LLLVFLRALEYFRGILFLTTNRIGAFDAAVMTRIHVQIYYSALDDTARDELWRTKFKKLADNYLNGGRKFRYEHDAKQYVLRSKDLRELKWNGREISNGTLEILRKSFVTPSLRCS